MRVLYLIVFPRLVPLPLLSSDTRISHLLLRLFLSLSLSLSLSALFFLLCSPLVLAALVSTYTRDYVCTTLSTSGFSPHPIGSQHPRAEAFVPWPPSSTPIHLGGSHESERGEESRCRAARVLHSRGSASAVVCNSQSLSLLRCGRATAPIVDAKSVSRRATGIDPAIEGSFSDRSSLASERASERAPRQPQLAIVTPDLDPRVESECPIPRE